VLIRELKRKRVKFCVFDRDFEPGVYIHDNIQRLCTQSKHMVVIFTSNLINKDNRYKYAMDIFMTHNIEQGGRVYPIILSGEDEIPEELRRLSPVPTIYFDRVINAIIDDLKIRKSLISDEYDEISIPYGTMSPDDPIYVERDADKILYRRLSKIHGATIFIVSPWQTGKSSVIVKCLDRIRMRDDVVIYIDLQPAGSSYFKNWHYFIKMLMEYIAIEIDVEIGVIKELQEEYKNPLILIDKFMERYVLSGSDYKVVLAIDEVDRVMNSTIRDNFLRLMIYWSNKRSSNGVWRNLDLILSISSGYFSIENISMPRFGEMIRLQEFNTDQVKILSTRYKLDLSNNETRSLIIHFGGHPYLTNLALGTMLERSIDWPELRVNLYSPKYPFLDYLDSQWQYIQKNNLSEILNNIMSGVVTEKDVLLEKSGIVKRSDRNNYVFWCKIYRDFFRKRLKTIHH
jgi:hypothetical protein